MGKEGKWRILVDTGGTFTDALAYTPEGKLKRCKVLSDGSLRGRTVELIGENSLLIEQRWGIAEELIKGFSFSWSTAPHESFTVSNFDAAKGILQLDKPVLHIPEEGNFKVYSKEEAPVLATRILTATPLHQEFPPLDMRLGFTKGTNALLERKGGKVLLITNKGFEDLPYIRYQQRPDIFALNIQKKPPLVEEAIGLSARLDAQGQERVPFSEKELKKALNGIPFLHEYALAICLMHSYKNPIHEQAVMQLLEGMNLSFVCASHELSSAIKLTDRMETTLVEAYIGPLIKEYLTNIRHSLGGQKIKVMSSAGGLLELEDYRAKDSLLSGPAGGVVAAAHTARCLGLQKLLTLDMGGTSTDVSRYDGKAEFQAFTRVGDAAILSPSLMIETVAAGGGSVCDFDGIQLIVGPESAGANPGPACYGAGGPLTVTDVNLLLGRLAPDQFGFPVHIEKAKEALMAVKNKLPEGHSQSDENLLRGFLSLANEKMAEAIRKISIKKGFDAKEYALLAFGGAGGQHACGIAEKLGIQEIVAPFHAGLLSAEGMGLAKLERFASKQVLQSLNASLAFLPDWIGTLEQEVREALTGTSGEEEVHIEERNVFLRLKGQESSLPVDYYASKDLAADFRTEYLRLYKHWPEDAEIEVESIRVLARKGQVEQVDLRTERSAFPAVNVDEVQAFSTTTPVFDWATLQEGAQVTGPALVVSPFATFFVDQGWQLSVQKEHCLTAIKVNANPEHAESQDETTRLSLFTHRFQALAEDMGALLERTAFSVNVKERLDFSCAILDRDGFLIANAPHIPVHLGSLGVCLRKVLQGCALSPGDVIVTNHPAFGGSHLPDVTMMCGAFDQEGHCLGYLINRAHHAEIGGKYPGSMPADATSLEEEGVVIPPVYIMRGDEANWEEIRKLLSEAPFPSRSLRDNMADLSAALASLQSGKEALETMSRVYGSATLDHYMKEIRIQTAQKLRRSLESFHPKLPLRATQYLDDGAPLSVEIREGREKPWCFDFSGSADVHPGNFNATEAIVHSVILYVLRLLVNEPIPLNEGLMEDIEVILPYGMLNPPFGEMEKMPAVVGGNTEISQRLTDTLLLAFGLAACSQGTMNNLLFGNENFGFYETIAGGTGAGPGYHGASGVHQHMTNTRITDPEIMEFRYPIRLECFALRRGSGGEGKFYGGDGLERSIRFLEPVVVTMLSQHRKEAPYGLEGGREGAVGKQELWLPGDATPRLLPGCFSQAVPEGSLLKVFTPGGGGYGEIQDH